VKKPKAWVILVGTALLASLLSSCTLYQVAKQEIVPGFKQVLIGVGPHAAEAIVHDLFAILGIPFAFGEKLLVPAPAPAPATP